MLLWSPAVYASHKSGLGWATFTQGPWAVLYTVTDTDGLAVNHAVRSGIEDFKDVKVPQIMVENRALADTALIDYQQLGVGAAANTRLCGSVQTANLYDGSGAVAGFNIFAEFRFNDGINSCFTWPPTYGYTYIQTYDFWYDGRVIPHLKIYGPGIGQQKYHAYWRTDIDANTIPDCPSCPRNDDFFEYYAISATQYPPFEHDFHDDEVYNSYPPIGYEWMNRDGAPTFRGYVGRPWVFSLWTDPPVNQNHNWTFVYNADDQQEQTGYPYDTTLQDFSNFPKKWDNSQAIYSGQDLVNWFVSTVEATDTPAAVCKPNNLCIVGTHYIPLNY